jgi:hypothetical protein
MKSKLNMIILAFATLFILQSCEESEFLNTTPLNAITSGSVFSDPALARANLLTVYEGMPKVFSRVSGGIPLDINAGDGNQTFPWGSAANLRNNDYNAANINGDLNFWTPSYVNIRQLNMFIEEVAGSKFDEATKGSFLDEARALRAVFYFDLYRFYGGVPIITKSLALDDNDALKLKRNTRDELADFIIKELTESAVTLPTTRTGADLGRMEKGAALGVLARVLIYQASLKNDASLFQKAALAAKSVMDMNRYSLFPDYNKLFLAKTPANNEYIFYYHVVPSLKHGAWNYVDWALQNAPLSQGGWGGSVPSLALVDEFEMIDGIKYSESPLFDIKDPYKNRDPRFYASIYYQGSTFKGIPFEHWVGGKDYDLEGHVTTGFFIKKGIDETVLDYYQFNNSAQDFYDPYLRYADVILMYAEAQNEFAGPDASVYNAINQIRQRAGMPLFPTGLNKEQMRDKIRHERHVELNMEESFFHDVRRWGIAVEMSKRDIWGQKIIKNADGSITYDRQMIEPRTFDPKYKLFPIPQSEIDKDPNLTQNPGY